MAMLQIAVKFSSLPPDPDRAGRATGMRAAMMLAHSSGLSVAPQNTSPDRASTIPAMVEGRSSCSIPALIPSKHSWHVMSLLCEGQMSSVAHIQAASGSQYPGHRIMAISDQNWGKPINTTLWILCIRADLSKEDVYLVGQGLLAGEVGCQSGHHSVTILALGVGGGGGQGQQGGEGGQEL